MGINTFKILKTTGDTFYWFIYTVDELSAVSLADDYCAEHSDYRVDNYWGDSHETNNCMKQFLHLHITNVFDTTNHLGGHICYGKPCLDTYAQGAWA